MKKLHSFKTCIHRFFLFIFFIFFVCINSCAEFSVSGDFYNGLAGLSDAGNISESVRLFEKSLKDSNPFIRQAAAEELANLIAAGTEVSPETERNIRNEVSGSWSAAFGTVDEADKEKALNFLFSYDQNEPFEAVLYVLDEFKTFFTEWELAAIEGHFHILELRYNEALESFRSFQEDGIWSENIPLIFLNHTELIVDLGKAFQYTSYSAEGLSLFLQWNNNLVYGTVYASLEAKYRLDFYSARIARRIGRRAQAISLFEQALPSAPDTEQSQACIWYIMDLSLSESSQYFIGQLEKFISHWGQGNYFNDVLEIFLQRLVSRSEWGSIIEVFRLIKDTSASAKAAYAWVIARIIEEGFLSNREKSAAAQAGNFLIAAPGYFFQSAYNAADNDVTSFIYYRSLSADALRKPLYETLEHKKTDSELSDAAQFLLGFFIHNVPEHAMRYIGRLEETLSVEDLRVIAAALADAQMYIQSIQLVLRYVDREGHIIDRTDMELLFPRPYMELVDMYAAETGIAPDIIYGLIRTESAFQSAVVSSAGAVGLTQLMPDTALDMAGRIRRAGGPDYVNSDNGLDPKDPSQNIHIGTYYLAYLDDRFDNILLSLLSYNGGMNRIRRLRDASSLPVDLFLETISINETRDYGRKVLGAAAVYEWLYYQQ